MPLRWCSVSWSPARGLDLLTDPAAQDRRFGTGFILANALQPFAGDGAGSTPKGGTVSAVPASVPGFDHLGDAFNIIECSRLRATGHPSSQDATPWQLARGIAGTERTVHPTPPTARAGRAVLGILNVVATTARRSSPRAVLTRRPTDVDGGGHAAAALVAEDRWHARTPSQEHLAEQLQMAPDQLGHPCRARR